MEAGATNRNDVLPDAGLNTSYQMQERQHMELMEAMPPSRDRAGTLTSTERAAQPWECLAFHPRISPAFRWGLPILSLTVAILNIASNCSVATIVTVDVLANSEPAVHLPRVF